ncbi:MAG: LPXTG cell wall anchor domain-containing protein [Pseudomonadota bacterium]
MKKSLKSALALAIVVGAAGSAQAQQKTCDDVVWSAAALEAYPAAAEACREVITHEGRDFVKMSAVFFKQHNNGALTVAIEETDGDMVRHSFKPQSEMRVWVDGEQKDWSDLYPRQPINVYVPSDRWEFASLNEEDPGMVELAMVVEEPPEEPAPEPMLPKTASNAPLVKAIGAGLLALGLFLGFRRRQV